MRQIIPKHYAKYRFDNRIRYEGQLIHVKDAFDLSQKSRQEPETSTSHADQACDYFRDKLFGWQFDTSRRPSAFKQLLELRSIQRPELMNKSNA